MVEKAALSPGSMGGCNGLFRVSRISSPSFGDYRPRYETAWAQIIARDPFRNTEKDGERRAALRKRLFALAGPGSVDFDTLCDKVRASMPECWALATDSGNARGSKVEDGRRSLEPGEQSSAAPRTSTLADVDNAALLLSKQR